MKNTTFCATALLALLAIGGLSACSRQSAEEKGKELATGKIDTAKGIGLAMEEKGEAASEAVVGGLGKVMKGFEKGVTKSGHVIATDASVDAAGLKITKVQLAAAGTDTSHGIDVYILANAEAHGKLRVLVFDVLNNEIARTSIELNKPADDGKYHTIPLDEKLSLSAISKVAFEFKPGPAPAAKDVAKDAGKGAAKDKKKAPAI